MNIASSVEVTVGVPDYARELIWNVFFTSRNRGISLSAHFPWIDLKENVFCLSVAEPRSSKTIAALVIKCIQIPPGSKLGLIGLVCVAEEWRGKGLSSVLMSEAIKFSEKKGFEALILWTQKPEVYKGHGFVVDSQDHYALVEKESDSKSFVEFKVEQWPDVKDMKRLRGYPPFAVGAKFISNSLANIIVVESKDGVTLAEWQGSDGAVVDLLESALPMRFGLNAREESSLFDEILKRNFNVEIKPGALRLVKYFKTSGLEIPEIKFLDRI